MRKLFLVMVSVALSLVLIIPAFAGKLEVVQNQAQSVAQGQMSMGGLSVSTQSYATAANQAYGIAKMPTFMSPSTGVATANTGNITGGRQLKYGSGIQTQGMTGMTVNNGGLYW
jgi:hypothetical protein